MDWKSLLAESRARNLDKELVAQAISSARAGDKQMARGLLEQACSINPANAQAWLWRASVAEVHSEAFECLEMVLSLDPNNATAHAWLEKLRRAGVSAPAPVFECPFCLLSAKQQFDRCPQCGCLLSIDLEAFSGNNGVNEKMVRQAMARYQAAPDCENSAVSQYRIGLACLNLLNSQDALQHLLRAGELDPEFPGLRQVIEALRQRQLIMTVDDSLTIRTMISNTLERNGYRTIAMANGIDALEYLEENTPRFILLDIGMPFMDGYMLCKAIRARPKTKRVPVVMLSGHDGFFDKVKGRLAGADDYLTKPFEPAALMYVIRKLVR